MNELTIIHETNAQEELPDTIETISIHNLSCGYDKAPVLHHLCHTFEQGKKYALVGPSGSGKSTLLKALMGYFPDYEGNIQYNLYELKQLSLHSLYDQLSLIDQNVFVFDESIQENITMFKEPDDSLLKSVINSSSLSGLIEEKGMEAKCGENGKLLSGGQKQRISIARALYSCHHLLFVDEATSALDHETAHSITNTLLKLKDTTEIIVTHHLDEKELSMFDEILFMKDGSIKEAGSFENLMKQKGLFYGLYTLEND